MADALPVLLDTDIGTNVDDAVALSYLLRQRRCELLGVTTVSGDVGKRAALAEIVCRAAGREDVPIHCGSPGPLLFGPGQPKVPHYEACRSRPHRTDRPAGTAVEFLRRTIRGRPGEVTLLTIGPFTNVALLFATDPEVPALLRRVVSMTGVFYPPAPGGRGDVETNARIDPVAAAMVFAAPDRFGLAPDGCPRHLCVGLDVTMQCRLPAGEFRRRFARPPLDVVSEMGAGWLANRTDVVFHDPLAAAVVFRPELCEYEDGRVAVDVTPDDPRAGRTNFSPGPGPHRVARGVDAQGFFDEFFSRFD